MEKIGKMNEGKDSMGEKSRFYFGKTILVTGGVGSIGSEIVKNTLDYGPAVVRVLDNNETGLFDLGQELNSSKIRLLVGDIKDKWRLKKAMEDVDIVFHVAALKHVPLCEYNPFEAVKTNVYGTQNLIDVAMDEEIEKFITISTDKAVNPTNVMGATKLLVERLTVSANFYKGKRKTAFTSVRFGNVLGSRGSVIPIFKKQIMSGGPVTLTHPEMTRFFMSMRQAINLIFKAAEMAHGGEIFIFKMPSIRIVDIAEVMIEELAPKFGFKTSDIEIKNIGIRSGEKIYEELIGKEEINNILETDDLYIILPNSPAGNFKTQFTIDNIPAGWKGLARKPSLGEYASNKNLINKEDVRKLLKTEGII